MRCTKLRDVVQKTYKDLTRSQKIILLDIMFGQPRSNFIAISSHTHRGVTVSGLRIRDYKFDNSFDEIIISYNVLINSINVNMTYYETLTRCNDETANVYIKNDSILDIKNIRQVLIAFLGRTSLIDPDYITDDMEITGFLATHRYLNNIYDVFNIDKETFKITNKTTVGDFVNKLTEYQKNKENI